MRISTICVMVWAWGCNPNSTRPAFAPYPDALTATVDAARQQLVPEISTWLAAAGWRVRYRSVEDGYVETVWQAAPADTAPPGGTPGAAAGPGPTVRLRVWVDPHIVASSRVTVEAVYRPFVDPSRGARELEVIVPQGHPARVSGERLIKALRDKFGVPPGA